MDWNEIINHYSKSDFTSFLENDYEGKVLELLNSEGLSILAKSPLREERISYILTFSKFCDKLFQNLDFLDVFFKSDLNYYYACLRGLLPHTYDIMLDAFWKLNPSPERFAKFFGYFSDEYIIQKLNSWPYGIDPLYELMNDGNVKVICQIIKDNNIDLADERINIELFISYAKQSVLKALEYRYMGNEPIEEIHFPNSMVNKDLAKRLLGSFDIFKVRRLVNDLAYCSNNDEVNDYVKHFEDTNIKASMEDKVNSPFIELFESFRKMKEASINGEDAYYTYRKEYFRIISKMHNRDLSGIIEEEFRESGISGVYDYLKELSNREISNYIIDYHFEENYYNIMIDIRELLRFYYDGNVVLDKDRVLLYEQISNIDLMSTEEKQELHEKLKSINIMEMFYDDMSAARYIVHEAIKESSLTKESIQKFRNEELSEQYGVDVYVMNDEPFFGIVKSNRHYPDDLPTGHSYSLVGNDCVAVFGNPDEANTFLYDTKDLNPDQIVHVFPFDSYTLFKPFNAAPDATNRINALMMPEEITGLSAFSYSEILILEQGSKQTDIDEEIPQLKQIALYCLDEINSKQVERAKSLGVGIVLIKSKKYFENKKYYEEKYKNISGGFNYKYYTDNYDKESFEAKR